MCVSAQKDGRPAEKEERKRERGGGGRFVLRVEGRVSLICSSLRRNKLPLMDGWRVARLCVRCPDIRLFYKLWLAPGRLEVAAFGLDCPGDRGSPAVSLHANAQ